MTEEQIARQPRQRAFENHAALTAHIVRMAHSGHLGSGLEWDAFLASLDAALATARRAGFDACKEQAAEVATSSKHARNQLCPYGRDKLGDPTWGHTDEDICPVCRKSGIEAPGFCTDDFGGSIAATIRAMEPEPKG